VWSLEDVLSEAVGYEPKREELVRRVLSAILAVVLSAEGAAQSRASDMPSPDSSRAPLILSAPPESALVQAKQLAASRFLQALQSGDDGLLAVEYPMQDRASHALPGQCASPLAALTALRTAAGRPTGRLPKGKTLPVYFFSPQSVDSAGKTFLRVTVVVPRADGRRRITPVTLEFESSTARLIGSTDLSEALCP